MNDYRKIRCNDTGRLKPKHTAMLHADSRLALNQFLESGDRGRSIVVTHHAPTPRSLPTEGLNPIMNAAYASDLDQLIFERGPALWIHGHIHEPKDFNVGRTRVINNGHGHPSADRPESNAFRADLVVELGAA